MNRTTREAAQRWLAEGREAIVIDVTEAQGSVPREAGTRMLVSAAEAGGGAGAVGTIGGGHLELKAIARAHEMLRTRELAPHTERFALGPALGQCCGGAVVLGHRALDAAALAAWPTEAPRFHLQLHGAGHGGRAVATLLATLDCRVDWFDERDDALPATTALGAPWPAHIHPHCIDGIDAEVHAAPAGAHYLVMTHDHDLDLRITEAVLRRGDFAYLGLIGSKTKRARFVQRFEQRGLAPEAIARLTCPIGVAGIGGKAPEIIAVAVVAQLLQTLQQVAPDDTGRTQR